MSVVVPVYNPGPYIDRCIASVLGQSLPASAYEAIFVDDGSTDETPARLDDLAASHPNIRVIHQENSGWPGKPRNVGIDAARGEYVFFLDNDDALGPEALERLHAMAVRNGSDIVIGKMAGHMRGVPKHLFLESRDRATLANAPLIDSLTPHKLFRRAFLDEHGLRFPEGRRRLEDHVFVLQSYFAADVISVVSDYTCYYHFARADRSNAASGRFDPPYYYGFVREVLEIVEAHTEPGPLRDRLLQRFARVELLGRLRGRRFVEHPPEYQQALFTEVRAVVDEHIPPSVDTSLSPLQRTQMALVRADRLDLLIELTRADLDVVAVARIRHITTPTPVTLRLEVEAALADAGRPLSLERHGDLLLVPVPGTVATAVPEAVRSVKRPVGGTAGVVVRRRDNSTEILPDGTIVAQLIDETTGTRVEWAVDITINPEVLAGGTPLLHGKWDVLVRLELAGYVREARFPQPAGSGDHRRLAVLDGRSSRTIAYWSADGYLVLDVRPPVPQTLGHRVRRRLGWLVARVAGGPLRR